MKDSIQIQRTGFYTTIQDQGRFGYAHLGIPESGVMDKKAMQLANTLVNNSLNEAVLEFTLVGPSIQFLCDRHFVITGGNTIATLDAKTIKNNTVYKGRKGQILELTKITEGCRGYFAIAGGMQSPSVLESKSMYVPITKSKTILKGASIPVGISQYGAIKGARLKIEKETAIISYLKEERLITYKGPEYDLLDEKLRADISKKTFTISKLWNRMAIQLEDTIAHKIPSITTGPVIPGTVQLTPSGRMMILMQDCQTTGGYPRILQLSESAMNVLAQKKQDDTVSFLLTS